MEENDINELKDLDNYVEENQIEEEVNKKMKKLQLKKQKASF